MDRSLKVGEMEEKAERAKAPSSHKSLGITVQNLTPEIAQGLGLRRITGVVVTQVEPESPAAEAGIQTEMSSGKSTGNRSKMSMILSGSWRRPKIRITSCSSSREVTINCLQP